MRRLPGQRNSSLWEERLTSYLDIQEGIEALRSRIQPNPPWPSD